MGTDVQVLHHSGIRVFQADLEGVCTGTLTFGVGRSDEPVLLAGITHLMEHLLFRLISPIAIENNGHVDNDVLAVYASGSPEDVGQFFNRLVAAIPRLAELTERDLELEKQILRIENISKFDDPTVGLMTYRYGLTGIGTASFGAPATTSFTVKEVVDWAETWLRADNATFAFSRELPVALNLPLPPGPVARIPQRDIPLATPALISSTKAGVAMSLLVTRDHAASLCVALQQDLEMELRHNRGLVYNVGSFSNAIDMNTTEIVVLLDPLITGISASVRVATRLLRKIAETGFSDAAVMTARNQVVVDSTRTFSALDYLERRAEDALFDRSTLTPDEQQAAATTLSAEHLQSALAASISTLIVAFDEDATISKKTLKSTGFEVNYMSPWEPIDEEPAASANTVAASNWRGKETKDVLVIADRALLKITKKYSDQILFSDIVLVGDRSCGCVVLVDSRGRSVEFTGDDWKHLKSLKRALLNKFDRSIVREFPKH